MKQRIPFLNLQQVHKSIVNRMVCAAERVIRSGRYLHGPETESFERELAAACGASYAVGVSNGLDALRLIFRAYMELGRLRHGDAVIVPANTYIASILPLTQLGLCPVMVDMDSATMNLDWHKAEQAALADEAVKAVMAVHLYGAPCWDREVTPRLMQRGLLVVEDNAQAIGATSEAASPVTGSRITGALGHAAAFSFYPTKNVGAAGDAGAVTTSDSQFAATVRALANYGSDRRYHNIYEGWNCRLDELQAAMLRIQLSGLDGLTARRRSMAALYSALISHPLVQKPAWQPGSVWHQYVVRVPGGRRDEFRAYMAGFGIGTDIHYATPPYMQPCYRGRWSAQEFPQSNRLAAECVSLPIAAVTGSDVVEVCSVINDWKFA